MPTLVVIALRALLVARSGAQLARTAAINQLKAEVLTAPVALRDQLRGLTSALLVDTCARHRPDPDGDLEVFGSRPPYEPSLTESGP